MWNDPVVDEIRKIRIKIESNQDNDFDKLYEQAIKTQQKVKNRLVSKPNLKYNDEGKTTETG
jgi:hypothetical protein